MDDEHNINDGQTVGVLVFWMGFAGANLVLTVLFVLFYPYLQLVGLTLSGGWLSRLVGQLPVMMKLSNAGIAYLGMVGGVYALNLFLLILSMAVSLRFVSEWRNQMEIPFDRKGLGRFPHWVLLVGWWRRLLGQLRRLVRVVGWIVLTALIGVLTIDWLADFPADVLRNTVVFHPWGILRVPLLCGAILGIWLLLVHDRAVGATDHADSNDTHVCVLPAMKVVSRRREGDSSADQDVSREWEDVSSSQMNMPRWPKIARHLPPTPVSTDDIVDRWPSMIDPLDEGRSDSAGGYSLHQETERDRETVEERRKRRIQQGKPLEGAVGASVKRSNPGR